jgi:F-type H+-transporting ATPase subunit b
MQLVAEGAPSGVGLFIPPWSEVIQALIVIAIIGLALHKVAVPAFLKILDERTEKIEGGLKKAEDAQEEAANAKLKRDRELQEALTEAGKIREQARAEGEQIVDEARAQAHAKADTIVENAQRQLESEKQAAQVALREEVGGLAAKLAEKIVGEALTDPKLSSRVVDRFLDELEASEQSPAKSGD